MTDWTRGGLPHTERGKGDGAKALGCLEWVLLKPFEDDSGKKKKKRIKEENSFLSSQAAMLMLLFFAQYKLFTGKQTGQIEEGAVIIQLHMRVRAIWVYPEHKSNVCVCVRVCM